MICSPETIKSLKIITPFRERYRFNGVTGGSGYAGYDIAVNSNVHLPSREFCLAATTERFTMPTQIVGICHDKSTWIRQGIYVGNTVLEPGWEGYLTLELFNMGRYDVSIMSGTPIAQVIFHTMDRASEGYSGKYNHQPNHPVEAIFDSNS